MTTEPAARRAVAGPPSACPSGAPPPITEHEERGQGTVEYALVLLAAAAVALALVAWVARSDAVGRLFELVIGRILSSA